MTAVQSDIDKGRLWPLHASGQSIGADVFLVTNPEIGLSAPEQEFVTAIEELLALEERAAGHASAT
ncbi:MAG: hypothetical protein AAFW98_07460 [Pseudomonadota bacterium]